MAKTPRKTLGKRSKPAPAKKPPSRLQLTEAHRELILRLSDRTGLEPEMVIERALAGYAAAAAPGMPLRVEAVPKGHKVVGQKLFLSVDGKPEIEIDRTEFVLGSAEGVDLRLDLPLISPRHARILWKGGRPVFEDLRSARGSYRRGQPVDVRTIESGDEIDLGGFLPIRFRLGDSAV
ncbi:MAG TPA: FHA domain-containing protein [Myxococcales bacterium]|nr:FHA domain-containing protein [Myxococcales bacterium]